MVYLARAAALALMVSASAAAAAARAGSTVVTAGGDLNKSTPSVPSSHAGVVAVLGSTASPDPFFASVASGDGSVSASSAGASEPVVVTAPGATLAGSGALESGGGAAAAASVAGSVLLTGVTPGDVQGSLGLGATRHGRTLSAVFTGRLEGGEEGGDGGGDKTLLIVAVAGAAEGVDVDAVGASVRDIFDECAVSVGSSAAFDDLYDLETVTVESDSDAAKVMEMATKGASRSRLSSSSGSSVTSALAGAYTQITGAGRSADPPFVTEVLLGCDDAYARHHRTARAKLAAWKSRAARGLTVDRFGKMAEDLLRRTVELYDRDTMVAAGLAGAAPYRLEMRRKLVGRIEKPVREVFERQVSNLQRRAEKRFESSLLRRLGRAAEGTENFYNSNADALRSAALAFEVAMDDLEVPSLALTKAVPVQEMSGRLNSALVGFPDTPGARMRELRAVKTAANKEKEPTERSVDVGLDLVGMVRPDGYGTLQGFVGRQFGGNQVIVGICNDADSPEVISQYGGVRPPFIRVQPKLKLDIEL